MTRNKIIVSDLKFILAPLAGYTDLPFRMACRVCGAEYAYTALIDAGALTHGNPDNEKILLRGQKEKWLGVQLLGSIPGDIAKSAEMLEDMDFDAVDFNMGCPMKKVIKRPAGAALMQPENQKLAFQCVKLIRERTTRPFTVKMRILDFHDPEPTIALCKTLQDLGVEGITIHGRLTASIYSGPVAVDVIRAVRESLDIPVTANGGIYSYENAVALAEQTGCSSVMIARGAIGNPWLFKELRLGTPTPPTHLEMCRMMAKHIRHMFPLYGDEGGSILGRKIIMGYLRGRGYSKDFRVKAGEISSPQQFEEFLKELRDMGPIAPTPMIYGGWDI